jgi:hypothetical protein
LLMPSRPLVLDSMYEGVSSCNAQQQETAQPSKKRARLQAIFSGELACTLPAWQEPQHHVQRQPSHIQVCPDIKMLNPGYACSSVVLGCISSCTLTAQLLSGKCHREALCYLCQPHLDRMAQAGAFTNLA